MQQQIDYKATYEFSKVVLCQYFEPYEKGWLLNYVSDNSKWEVTDTSGTFRGYIYDPVFIEYLNAGQIQKVTPPSEAEGQGEYNPCCDHKLENGFTSWRFFSESGGSGPDLDYREVVCVCMKCGDIQVFGHKSDGKHRNPFNVVFSIHHPEAIDAIIKQANYLNEETLWVRSHPAPSGPVEGLLSVEDFFDKYMRVDKEFLLPAWVIGLAERYSGHYVAAYVNAKEPAHLKANQAPVEADFETALEAEMDRQYKEYSVPDHRHGFKDGAKWARQYLSSIPDTPGPWHIKTIEDPGPEDVDYHYYLTDGKLMIRIDGGIDDESWDKVATFMNQHQIKLWSDDPSPLIISSLEEQIAHLKSQQAGARLDADELWDEYSEHVDDDIDSLQNVAGCSVITRRQFNKLMAKISDSPAPEQVDPQLITVYREYIQLLSDEISELSGLASIHGWKSKRAEMGEYYREMITKLQTKQP